MLLQIRIKGCRGGGGRVVAMRVVREVLGSVALAQLLARRICNVHPARGDPVEIKLLKSSAFKLFTVSTDYRIYPLYLDRVRAPWMTRLPHVFSAQSARSAGPSAAGIGSAGHASRSTVLHTARNTPRLPVETTVHLLLLCVLLATVRLQVVSAHVARATMPRMLMRVRVLPASVADGCVLLRLALQHVFVYIGSNPPNRLHEIHL
jgi:hypothetical protein